MDYDELSRDDLIGGTQINLYEVLDASTHEICIKRLLDDRSVSVMHTLTVTRRMQALWGQSLEKGQMDDAYR